MESRRTLLTFSLVTGIGMILALVLALAGDQLVKWLGAGGFVSVEGLFPYWIIVFEGVIVGAVLGRLVGYYPSLEGFFCSLVLVIRLLVRAELHVGLDSFVEMLLQFEAHFAALYFTAFAVFLGRGGGLYYPYFVGMRYLRFKMITAISVAGVALGVAAMVVVLSVMSGFELDLKQKIVGTNAHAIIQKRGTDFNEYGMVIEKIRQVPGVIAATPFVYNEVMISSDFNISGVFIKGIDPASAGQVTNLEDSIEDGRLELLSQPEKIDDYLAERTKKNGRGEKDLLPPPTAVVHPEAGPGQSPAQLPRPTDPAKAPTPAAQQEPGTSAAPPSGSGLNSPVAGEVGVDDHDVPVPEPLFAGARPPKGAPGIFIGKELKKTLKVGVGDVVTIVSPLSEELGPSGPVPKARSFRVAGIFFTGMYEYDAKSVYVNLKSAQEFFGMKDTITGIGLKFDKLDRAGAICAEIVSALDGYPYFTRTWYQMNKNLFTALKMEKIGMFILVVIVTLVSAFGIISTLIMLVWEKVKEIAILKSMGATGDGVMKIFMMEGITIGTVGTVLGLLMGWVFCLVLQRVGLQLDPEVYYIEGLPVRMDWVEFLMIAGIAFHISFIATIYPSRRASRLRPAEGLRYD